MVMMLFEMTVWVTVMIFLVTQIVFPFMQQRPWFPMLRRRSRKRELEMSEELLRLGDEETAAQMEARVKARRRELETLKYGPRPEPVRGVHVRDEEPISEKGEQSNEQIS